MVYRDDNLMNFTTNTGHCMSAIIYLCYLVVACNLQQADSWAWFRPQEGACEIMAPGPMLRTWQEIDTDMGKVDYYTYHHKRTKDSLTTFAFSISFYRLDTSLIPRSDIDLQDAFLDATVDQSAKSIDGEVIFQDAIKYRLQFPGRYWRLHAQDGELVIKTKAYLTDAYFYSVQVAVQKAYALSPDIERFLDSFQIIQ